MRDPEETHGIDWRGPWVIVDLDDGWEAVYSLAPQGSDIVISRVEIRPRMPPGVLPPGGLTTRLTRTLRPPLALKLFRDKLAEYLTPGTDAFRSQGVAIRFLVAGALSEQIGSGAVTTETAAAVMTFLAADEPGWQDWLSRQSERWAGWGAALDELRPGSRRPPRDRLRRLAETAALYVSARADNDPAPNRRVAEIQGRTAERVRDDLRAARRAELLTETPGRGRAGGTLMAKAREILESE
jgi:hypothetical protein